MKIKKITVSNFKGLLHAEFTPTQFACLVGENNAGKSTVLQSIVYALNRPTQLPPDLFYRADTAIEFRLEFTEVTEPHLARLAEEHKAKITDLIVDQGLTLIVRYHPGQKADIRVEKLIPNEPRYRNDHVTQTFSGKRGAAVRQALVETYPEFADDVPTDLNVTSAKQLVSQRIRQLPNDQFSFEEAPLPSGMSSSITALLPEPIYIPAVKNLTDDLKTSQSTSFGRLLGLLLEDMSPDLTAINQSLEVSTAYLTASSVMARLLIIATIVSKHLRVRSNVSSAKIFRR